ncbi:MAG: carboxypeptidase-like regulatory domain-containing protein [Cytophagales bacterium]|nr:carboxypeptidase-like regulatory domain-containing protein [Cytophagales bacterium]
MSIPTINGSIISNYPVFEGSQVLTSEQLNGMFEYLDQQNRFTRSRLIGIGTVCGLQIRTYKNQVILSEGIGITSDGFIVKMPECTMSYQRDYFLPGTVAYEAFGSYDDDNIFTQDDDIILYELLSKKPEEGTHEDLTLSFLEDKYLLIFLECFDRDPRSCLGKNCEDLGKERIFTTRKLAVNESGLKKILTKTNGRIENPYYPSSELLRVDLKKPLFDPDGDESKVRKSFVMNIKAKLYESGKEDCVHHLLFGEGDNTGLIQETYTEFQPLLEPAYNYQDPFANNSEFKKVKNALRSYLAGATGDNLKGVQYVYEFYELLIDSYHTFLDVGARIAQDCCPDKDFSLHLILGKIMWDEKKSMDEWNLLGRSEYRQQFLQPKIHNSQSVLLKELNSIHRKLILLVESFQINVIKEKSVSGVDETIKITPLDLEAGAIPRYLIPDQKGSVPGIQTTDLETEWDFETTVTGKTPIRVRSYDRNWITPSNLFPAQNDYVGAPLHYRTYQSTFRTEAIFGEKLEDVVKGEEEIRDTFHLPFTILPVKINPNPDNIIVDPRHWQDLQTAYNVSKGELNVTFKNLIAVLKVFERAAQDIDFGLTTVNVNNFKFEADQVLSAITNAGGLFEQANELVSKLPARIEALYDQSGPGSPFLDYYTAYRNFRRNLNQNLLRLKYASEILIHEKIDVLQSELFHQWENWIDRPCHGIMDFMSNNDFFQLHKLYYSFVARYQFLQENHYSILCNFLRVHPGVGFNAIRNDGTHILIYEESEEDATQKEVFANFTLPYRLDPDQIDIPLDDELEKTKLPPLARGESLLLTQGQTWLVDSTANDLEPNGDLLKIDSKGFIDSSDQFKSGRSFSGGKVVSHAGINAVLRYEPLKSFTGQDHFQYTVESEADDTLQDTAFVEVLVVSPYRKHIQAVDDLAATNNHHSVTIRILENDVEYPGTKVILPPKSTFGAPLSLLSDNQVLYQPVYGREGKDTFKYTLEYEFMTDGGLQVETSEAEVEVIVFCCNRMEFEVICEGNTGEFLVLTDREIDENASLTLINEDGEPMESIIISDGHFIEVRERDGVHYLYYQPDIYFKGTETFVYEVTDREGFMRRVKLEILVMPCTETYLRRVICGSRTRLDVLEEGKKSMHVYEDRNDLLKNLKTLHGEVSVQEDGSGEYLSYLPDLDYTGLDIFQFTYEDDQGIRHYQTMQVMVECCEKVRIETVCKDTSGVFEVLTVAMKDKKYVLKLYEEKRKWTDSIATQSNGVAEVNAQGIKYQPPAGFIGLDTFHYIILKGDSMDAEAVACGKFHVLVDTNRQVEVEHTFMDNAIDLNVLTPEQVSDGATLSINVLPTVKGATAEVAEGDEKTPYIKYTPALLYAGTDSFGYVITTGEVRVCVTFFVIVDAYERIEVINVLQNEPRRFNLYRPDQEVTDFQIFRAPVYGKINLLEDNEIEYDPEKDFQGNDKMRYRAMVDGEVKHGKVFFLVTCDCDDTPIRVTGTVSDDTPFVIDMDNVRVEEEGTGNFVLTTGKGNYSIDVLPNATLRFSKPTLETLLESVSNRTVVDVVMSRKVVSISGTVKNVESLKVLEGVSVAPFSRSPVETSSQGFYSLEAYSGFRTDYSLNNFIPQSRMVGDVDAIIDVDLVPIVSNTEVTVSGAVFEDIGDGFKVIEDASYELSGQVFTTSLGNFSFTVEVGTSVTFMAPGYRNRSQITTGSDSAARVVLFPENEDPDTKDGTVTGRVTDGENTLPGGTVVIKGTTIGTLVDLDGQFSLSGLSLSDTLIVSHNGYISREVPVTDFSQFMEIVLTPRVSEEINTEVLSGRITDQDNNQPLAGVVVTNGDRQAITDAKGNYELRIEKGTPVSYEFDGYIATNFEAPTGGDWNLSLKRMVEGDQEIEVTGAIFINKEPAPGEVSSKLLGTKFKTDDQGRYTIQTRVGDVLTYRVPQTKNTQQRTITLSSGVTNISFVVVDQA